MTYAELRTDGFPFGANCTPPADLVGGYLAGALIGARGVVQAERLYAAAHELDERHDPDREAYGTVYQYPHREYVEHFRANRTAGRDGSPRGYAGPAACCRLVWDIDRADPDAALADTRTLAQFVTVRYGEDGFGAYFSGGKGYHLSVVAPPGFHPLVHVPDVVKMLCLTVARAAGVAVDPAVYDRQRLFRLPNTRHPRAGLYKRFLAPDELARLGPERVRELARHPAAFPVPAVSELSDNLETDWLAAERRVLAEREAVPRGWVPSAGSATPSPHPVVPLYVREFIGFGSIQDPGRAVTLFRAAAVLSEAGTPPAVVRGLLEEPALKTGLGADEVGRQLAAGIEHGRRKVGAA